MSNCVESERVGVSSLSTHLINHQAQSTQHLIVGLTTKGVHVSFNGKTSRAQLPEPKCGVNNVFFLLKKKKKIFVQNLDFV